MKITGNTTKDIRTLAEELEALKSAAVEEDSTPTEARRRAINVLNNLEERQAFLEARLDEMSLEVDRIVAEQAARENQLSEDAETVWPAPYAEGDLVRGLGPIPGTMTTNPPEDV